MAKIGSLSSLFILQSKSINFNFEQFWAKYQGYSLTLPKTGQNWLIDHHFSFCNQSQSISILVIFGQNTKAIALLFGQNWLIFHHFSFCNQSQSISILVIFGQNTKAIALLLAKIGSFSSLVHSAIKVNQFQFWSFWAKYQGYSLTFGQNWLIDIHHFSFCNQSQSISILVIFGQNTKAIALLFGQNWLIFITFHSAIKVNQFQFWSFLGKIPRL